MDNTENKNQTEQQFWDQFWTDASSAEKFAAVLIIFSFFVGTFNIMGDMAILGVIMAGAGTAIAVFKKNWALTVFGAIDFFILLSYMNDIAEINDIMNY